MTANREPSLAPQALPSKDKHGDASTQNLEKVATLQFELVHRRRVKFKALRFGDELPLNRFHRPLPCINFAACFTASIMRGCVPHLQILPCKNRTISSRFGLPFVCSKPTELITIPEVQ